MIYSDLPRVVKYGFYNIIDPEPFELPMPMEFELLHRDTVLQHFWVAVDGAVDFSFNTDTKHTFLTPVNRPLTINDLYVLIRSRCFPENTPLTPVWLEVFGLIEYNPFEIVKRTHGLISGDEYWLRFRGENINFRSARKDYEACFLAYYEAHIVEEPKPEEPNINADESFENIAEDISHILGQREVDLSKMAELAAGGEPMSAEEFRKSVIGEDGAKELKPLTVDDLDVLDSSAESVPPSSGSDKMSDDAIAALLGGAENSPPAPAPSGGSDKMSDDAIAALLAGNSPPAPAPSGGSDKMSDDAIAALLANNG